MIVTLSSHSEIIKSIGRMSRRLFPDCNLVEEDEKYFSSDDCCCWLSMLSHHVIISKQAELRLPRPANYHWKHCIFLNILPCFGWPPQKSWTCWMNSIDRVSAQWLRVVYCGNARKRATCRQSIEISVWNLKWLWFAFCSGLNCEFIQFKPLLPVPADNSSTTGQKLRRKICFVWPEHHFSLIQFMLTSTMISF